MISPGMIAICGTRKPVFIQKVIMLTGNSPYSHGFLTTLWDGDDSAFEASYSVQTVSMDDYNNDPNAYYELYSINPKYVTAQEINAALHKVYKMYAGMQYGYLQLPWFIWRRINAEFGRDIHRELNWFNMNIICTGLIFDYLIECGMGQIIPNVMSEYHPSTIAPWDTINILQSNPDIFLLEGKKT